MPKIVVASARKSAATIVKQHPGATILNVTSRGPMPWQRFSPFFPHDGIPVPFSPGVVAASVEGLWQGLKVFEREGVDRSKLDIRTMKNLKRTTRSHGRVLGHARGIASTELLDYATARRDLYLPSYRWVLENKLANEVEQLRALAATSDVVLLDYETNGDVNDLRKPLSHAALVAMFVLGTWP